MRGDGPQAAQQGERVALAVFAQFGGRADARWAARLAGAGADSSSAASAAGGVVVEQFAEADAARVAVVEEDGGRSVKGDFTCGTTPRSCGSHIR